MRQQYIKKCIVLFVILSSIMGGGTIACGAGTRRSAYWGYCLCHG